MMNEYKKEKTIVWNDFFYLAVLCYLIGTIFFFFYNVLLIYAGCFTVGSFALLIVMICATEDKKDGGIVLCQKVKDTKKCINLKK